MAEIVVTDEAVEAGLAAINGRWPVAITAGDVHAALEAAAPLLQVRVDRQTLALLLADTVQTLDKDEEWFIADRVLALLSPEETK